LGHSPNGPNPACRAASGFPPSVVALTSSSQAPLPGSLGKAVWAGSQIAKVVRASDILLTRSAYRIGSGLVCRVRPGSGVGDVPQPGVAPVPRFRRLLRHPTRCSLLSRIVLRRIDPKLCEIVVRRAAGSRGVTNAPANLCGATTSKRGSPRPNPPGDMAG